MSPRRLLLALALLVSATAGCFDPIVGARCADGYVPCHGLCVAVCATNLDGSSPLGDGAVIPGDGANASGETGSLPDGGQALDASTTDGLAPGDGGGSSDAPNAGDIPSAGDAPTTGDAATGDAAAIDAASPTDGALAPDAGAPDASDASIDDAAATDAAVTDGATADAGASDTLPADAGLAPDAPPPVDCGTQTLCPIGCVNLTDDPDNCGSCGFSCGSGLCINSVCQMRQAGHLVVIGHDYTVSRTAMDNVVGNAVFLAPALSVKVLAYHGAATLDEIRGTDNAIQKVATSLGRTWVKTAVLASDVPASLAFADVLVIYAQAGATDPELLALGNSWSTALSDFVQAGKTIVVLEGAYPNAGTFQIVQQANLFHATGRTEVTGQTLVVARAGDAVVTRVPQTYRGERGTVWFSTMDQSVVVQVATDAGIQPVVIHLVF